MATFADHGIDVSGHESGEVRVTCPECSASRRKSRVRCLVVNTSDGVWHCHHCGWSGALRADARVNRAELDRLRRQAEADRELRYQANKPMVSALWDRGFPLAPGDAATLYLKLRGLILDRFPNDLRYCPKLAYYDDDGKEFGQYPALLASVRDWSNGLVAVHRTYLRSDGSKAPVPTVKKLSMTCGPIVGAAIRLFPPSNGTLGVAEGLETSLAAFLGSGVSTWSAISASGLKGFQWPPGVRKLLVFGDNDPNGVGQESAHALADRARQAGLAVRVLIPEEIGQDWADVWADRTKVAA